MDHIDGLHQELAAGVALDSGSSSWKSSVVFSPVLLKDCI